MDDDPPAASTSASALADLGDELLLKKTSAADDEPVDLDRRVLVVDDGGWHLDDLLGVRPAVATRTRQGPRRDPTGPDRVRACG